MTDPQPTHEIMAEQITTLRADWESTLDEEEAARRNTTEREQLRLERSRISYRLDDVEHDYQVLYRREPDGTDPRATREPRDPREPRETVREPRDPREPRRRG